MFLRVAQALRPCIALYVSRSLCVFLQAAAFCKQHHHTTAITGAAPCAPTGVPSVDVMTPTAASGAQHAPHLPTPTLKRAERTRPSMAHAVSSEQGTWLQPHATAVCSLQASQLRGPIYNACPEALACSRLVLCQYCGLTAAVNTRVCPQYA
jgi:hypothetical protein